MGAADRQDRVGKMLVVEPRRELREAGVVPDSLDVTDDSLPIVDLSDDELDELLGSGPETAS